MTCKLLRLGISVCIVLLPGTIKLSLALPPPEDLPEEVLRTEIITEARSPIDGKLLSAAEYAQLQAQLAESRFPPQLDPKARQTIFLLRLRELVETIKPF